jgi:hypothetical protein
MLCALPWCVATGVLAPPPPPVTSQTLSVISEFEAPRLETVGNETRVSLAGCETLYRVGEPVLPFRTVRLALPPGTAVASVEAQAETPPLLSFVQPPVEFGRLPTRTPGGAAAPATEASLDRPDATIYLSDAPYPAASAELTSIQRLGGYDIAFVRVYPVQYQPLSGQLAFTAKLRVTLALAAPDAATPPPVRPAGPDTARPRVQAMVDNADLLAADAGPALLNGPSPAIFDYLLVTRSNLVSAFQPLVNQKVLDGLLVKVETVENITSSQAGRDTPEKLRNYLRYAYTNWGITYVLLGGDIATVPCRYGYAYMGSLATTSLVPTDLYYACLDGSWDKNGNSVFGEPTDGETGGEVDLLAEVYVGRAPVDTVAEVGIFVQKTLRYETEVHPHRTNVLFMAEYLGSTGSGPSQGWDMFVPLLPYFTNAYQIARLDDAPFTTPQWTKANAITALNASPHLALFNGHGDTDAMMRLYTEDVALLTNQWLFLTYSVGCNAGEFDNDIFSPDCIGEELVKQHSRGAFAAILNSRLGWYDPLNEWRWSGEFQIQFFREMLTNGNTRLGVANQLSKHDMVSQVETSGLMTYRWCYFEITLFGDPHVAWQTPPDFSQLVVSSPHGGASPPVGTNRYSAGSLVTCAVTNSPLSGGAGQQYVCTGWSGTGSVPARGGATQVNLTLTTNSQIAWTWKTQVWFAAGVSGSGFVTASNGWRDAGTALAVQATASNYYHFVSWTGDVPPGMESNASLNLTMNQPRTLTAVFAANLTSQGTPEWWLASYGWTNQFEAASLADSDHDGMAAWQEYVAGTSPVDPASVLRLTLTREAGPGSGRVLRWPSVANRWYSVYRANSPNGAFAPLTNGMVATPPLNTFTDPAAGDARFYRVGVTNSP